MLCEFVFKDVLFQCFQYFAENVIFLCCTAFTSQSEGNSLSDLLHSESFIHLVISLQLK